MGNILIPNWTCIPSYNFGHLVVSWQSRGETVLSVSQSVNHSHTHIHTQSAQFDASKTSVDADEIHVYYNEKEQTWVIFNRNRYKQERLKAQSTEYSSTAVTYTPCIQSANEGRWLLDDSASQCDLHCHVQCTSLQDMC